MITESDAVELSQLLGQLWVFGDTFSIHTAQKAGLATDFYSTVRSHDVANTLEEDRKIVLGFLKDNSYGLLGYECLDKPDPETVERFLTNLCFLLKEHEDFEYLDGVHCILSKEYPELKHPDEIIQSENRFSYYYKHDFELFGKVISACSDIFNFDSFAEFKEFVVELINLDYFGGIRDVSQGLDSIDSSQESYLLFILREFDYRQSQRFGFEKINEFIPCLLLYLVLENPDQSEALMKNFHTLDIEEVGKDYLRLTFPELADQI